jgi:hypothetical protein
MIIHSVVLAYNCGTDGVHMKVNQTMAEFIADQVLTAPEQTVKILSVFGDNPPANVQALTRLAKTHQTRPMVRRELITEINRLCLPTPELNRCPHTPDLFK